MTIERPSMPAAMKEQWLDALRSGKYDQTIGQLYEGGGYCCLGVLQQEVSGGVECIVDIDDRGIRETIVCDATAIDSNPYNIAPGIYLSKAWMDKHNVQLDVSTGMIDDFDTKVSFMSLLAILNDGRKTEGPWADALPEGPQDFNYIADYIEANVDGV